MRRALPASAPALRVNDLLFVNEYMANGRNGTRAYQSAHPKCSYQSARKCASELLAKPHIQVELASRVQHEAGITRALVESDLLTYRSQALEKHDYIAGASIAMDCAKLAGFLVEKHADVTPAPTLTTDQLAEALRARGFVPVPVN